MPVENTKKEAPKETKEAPEKNDNEPQTLHLHNPFTGEEKEITQEELDNLEQFKEAQTERD